MPSDTILRASAVLLEAMTGLPLTPANGSPSVSRARLQDEGVVGGVLNDLLESVCHV